MQNNNETVIRINGETIKMSDFKDFSLDVLTYCFAHGFIDDVEDYEIIDFIGHVNGVLEELELEELTEVRFVTLQSVTLLVLTVKTNICSVVDAEHLAKFTNAWRKFLFTDAFGSTFKETSRNLSRALYGF